ncbi:exodeoxyribonuclease VII large subunit [Bartonella sp. TP]|uniref:exodeoxyribonuclease VII large subunit n=1 Tax=Bartonella sp. TP TaxID=3057550 RepID=UPI0025AF5E37|nr:exodeoxyribonuclease VII large subunit [Bartonella sp. TP]MDN5249136.1 exodeoxyribonuclease VII large subunit [Alphaproteobacteria bacterium]WJW80304.1 exodeoxyribonuclease VII large subunit [Bartonella sp. TP]
MQQTLDLEYSVSELSLAIKQLLQGSFSNICVRGEISGYRGQYSSGHVYFSLKDNSAKIDAVIWKTVFSSLKFNLEEGMEVVAFGNISAYAPSSKYNFVITSIKPAGVGSLMELFEKRKKQLLQEGLFALEHKKVLPFIPQTIGVITSASGSVIRDIIHRIEDRFACNIILWPVTVQGVNCAKDVAEAIAGFNALPDFVNKPDVIIIARGGGSIEDLWGFNEEAVVRAAFESKIPLISAIGHETDYTLLDLVADKRAPTPSAAAEMAVPVKRDLLLSLENKQHRLGKAIIRNLKIMQNDYSALTRAMPSLEEILRAFWQRFVEKSRLLVYTYERKLQKKSAKFTLYAQRYQLSLLLRFIKHSSEQLKLRTRVLSNLSYQNVLQRGFALVTGQDKRPICRAKDVVFDQKMQLRFIDNTVNIVAPALENKKS